MLYLLYLVGALLIPGAFPIGCGPAEQPAPLSAADGELSALPTPELSPITPAAEHEAAPIQASGNGSQDVAVSMDPPDDELPDDGNAPVLSSWVANLPGGSAPENMVLMTPLNLVAGDAGNEEQVRLRWSVESANQLAFMIQRQQWWGEQWIDSDLIVAPPFPYTYTDSPGAGLWRYAIAAANTDGMSPPTEWSQVRVDSSWTTFTPSADTRIVYVSSSEGNDSNNGLSTLTPKATIAAGYALLRHGYPDWLLLKRGDVWENQSLGHWRKSGRSATEMMVVNTYGDAIARPLLRTGTGNGFTRQGGNGSPAQINYVAVLGIDFLAHTRIGSEGSTGFWWLGAGETVLVEDCRFSGFAGGMTIQGSATDRPTNVLIRRTIVIDSYRSSGGHSQGIFANYVHGLTIEQSAIIRNGWHQPDRSDATVFNHNLYLSSDNSDVIVRDNVIARGSSHGLQLRPGGIVTGNIFIENPLAAFVSRGEGITSIVRDNIVIGRADINSSLPRGYGIDAIDTWDAIIENNLLIHGGSIVGSGVALSAASDADAHLVTSRFHATFRSNIVYDWNGTGFSASHSDISRYDDIALESNTLVLPSSRTMVAIDSGIGAPTRFTFTSNRYHHLDDSSPAFRVQSSIMNFATWTTTTNDHNSVVQSLTYPDPSRDVGSYSVTIGLPPTTDAFLEAVTNRSLRTWPQPLDPSTLGTYLRSGFGL